MSGHHAAAAAEAEKTFRVARVAATVSGVLAAVLWLLGVWVWAGVLLAAWALNVGAAIWADRQRIRHERAAFDEKGGEW